MICVQFSLMMLIANNTFILGFHLFLCKSSCLIIQSTENNWQAVNNWSNLSRNKTMGLIVSLQLYKFLCYIIIHLRSLGFLVERNILFFFKCICVDVWNSDMAHICTHILLTKPLINWSQKRPDSWKKIKSLVEVLVKTIRWGLSVLFRHSIDSVQ